MGPLSRFLNNSAGSDPKRSVGPVHRAKKELRPRTANNPPAKATACPCGRTILGRKNRCKLCLEDAILAAAAAETTQAPAPSPSLDSKPTRKEASLARRLQAQPVRGKQGHKALAVQMILSDLGSPSNVFVGSTRGGLSFHRGRVRFASWSPQHGLTIVGLKGSESWVGPNPQDIAQAVFPHIPELPVA